MEKLFPIVRRVRRPLLPVDDAPQVPQEVIPAPEPKQTEAAAVEQPQQTHADAPEN